MYTTVGEESCTRRLFSKTSKKTIFVISTAKYSDSSQKKDPSQMNFQDFNNVI